MKDIKILIEQFKRLTESDFTLLEGYYDIDTKQDYYILYHATPEANVENIQQQGLKPSIKTTEYSESLVWLADTPQAAEKHAASQMRKKGITGNIAIFKVTLDPKIDKLYKAIQPGIYTVEGIISPNKLKLIK